MKKKILMMAILSLVFTTSGFAQFKRTAFNHVGLNAGVGTAVSYTHLTLPTNREV